MDAVEQGMQEGNGDSGRFHRPRLGTTIPETGLFGNKRSLRKTRLFSGESEVAGFLILMINGFMVAAVLCIALAAVLPSFASCLLCKRGIW